ncbi:unnamed protein product [Notodromas monacha]|uniref:UDP-glucuronosyltransferase n=1 Tax=Notodromas monacha TaxID=399045 RepID=A0A7R9BYC1_9CRUS|nr:unnamed protein product [Notodromas monacha]CAG0924002.1 unnamed protein product [Notodromas monacha]
MAKYRMQVAVPWDGMTPDSRGSPDADINSRILSKGAVSFPTIDSKDNFWDLFLLFDYVLLTTHVANECMFGFINRLKVPFGYFFSAGDLPWSSVAVGNPIPTSFVPYLASVYGDRMNFVERMMNFGFTWAVQATRQRTYSQVEPIVREAFKWSPEDPSIPELEKNVSLVVLNQDQRLFQYPGPTMPNMIEIGGAHCRPPKRLPKNLKTWFDKSGTGNVIFFSMGSAVSSNNFPKQKWQAFVQAFQRVSRTLEVRILLKWDGQVEELAEDANFLVLPWIPQQDVLGHQKVKLFITHGGLLSSQETTFHAVPILGIPVGADQMMNLKRISDADAGKMLLWGDITTQRLVSDITDVLTDPNSLFQRKSEIPQPLRTQKSIRHRKHSKQGGPPKLGQNNGVGSIERGNSISWTFPSPCNDLLQSLIFTDLSSKSDIHMKANICTRHLKRRSKV